MRTVSDGLLQMGVDIGSQCGTMKEHKGKDTMRNFLWCLKELAIMFALGSMVLLSAAIGTLLLLRDVM